MTQQHSFEAYSTVLYPGTARAHALVAVTHPSSFVIPQCPPPPTLRPHYNEIVSKKKYLKSVKNIQSMYDSNEFRRTVKLQFQFYLFRFLILFASQEVM